MPAEEVTIELKGSEEAQKEFERIAKSLTGRRMADAMESVSQVVAETVREFAPHDLGDLLASIQEEVLTEPDMLSAVVFSDSHYAAPQERGTDPYWPPVDALEGWAERHGVDAYYVAWLISQRGILPLRFMQRALEETEDLIVKLIGAAVARIVEKKYG